MSVSLGSLLRPGVCSSLLGCSLAFSVVLCKWLYFLTLAAMECFSQRQDENDVAHSCSVTLARLPLNGGGLCPLPSSRQTDFCDQLDKQGLQSDAI